MNAIRIVNPYYVGKMAPYLEKYLERVPMVGINYESFYMYLSNSVQFGGNATELWIVEDEGEALAFAHWMVRAAPYIATTYCDHIYRWNNNNEPINMLIEKWIDFSHRNRCIYLGGSAVNKKLLSHYHRLAEERGYPIADTLQEFVIKVEPTEEVDGESLQ